jgi:hypothetical protein
MTIKGILLAAGIIVAALLLMPRSETAGSHDGRTHGATAPRAPYPCESDRSAPCTWEQYRQIAEEDCAKDRAHGGQCEVITNVWPPRAIHISSESERADMRQKIDEGVRRLCDNLANAGYECHAGH